MSISVAMALLREKCSISISDLERIWAETWPTLPPVLNAAQDKTVTSFQIGEVMVFWAEMGAPFPWSDLEGPCATSLLWPTAAEELQTHQVHWILSLMGEFDPLTASTLLTQVTTVFLKCCPAALGVYWGNATLLVPKPMFIDFAESILPIGPPLLIWVDFRVGTETARTSSGFSTGMKALGFMEIEAVETPEPPGKLRERMLAISEYLIQNGPVIRNGDTLGEDEHEKIRVVFSPSAFGQEGEVMRLVYESASSRKPWWKLWGH